MAVEGDEAVKILAMRLAIQEWCKLNLSTERANAQIRKNKELKRIKNKYYDPKF